MTEPETAKQEKQKKKAGFIMPVIVVIMSVLVVGGIIVYMNYTNFAKMAVEKMATRTLGVDVAITDLVIDVPNMRVDVSGLHIANPQGYENPHAMVVDAITIDLKEFKGQLVTFEYVAVTGTKLNLEVTQNGTNLTAIRNNMNRKATATDASAQKTDTPAKEPMKVIIDQLLINNATLHPSSVLAGGEMASVVLPDILLKGIGRKENGVLASEAMAQILDYVTRVAIDSAAKSGFLTGMNTESLKALQGSLGLSAGFVDKAKEDLKELGNGLKGLLGR